MNAIISKKNNLHEHFVASYLDFDTYELASMVLSNWKSVLFVWINCKLFLSIWHLDSVIYSATESKLEPEPFLDFS